MIKPLIATSILALSIAAPFAQAHQAGDFIVRGGVVQVDATDRSSSVRAGGAPVYGVKATVDNNMQFGLNLQYMVTDRIGLELLGASPFKHNITMKDPNGALGLNNVRLGSVRHLPPTLSVVFYPMDPICDFQPYIGAGLNYTWFYKDELSSQAKAAGFDGLDLKNSKWGWAAQVGVDYMVSPNWMLNAQVRYIDIKTEARTMLGGNTPVKVKYDLDPWVWMVGVGYKF